MNDRQFSIPAPWDEPEGKKTRVMIDCFSGGKEYLIEVKGKLIRFEWSERFGPMPINKDGSEARSIGPYHKFWRAASLWNLQGRRIVDGKAFWHEPRKPIYVIKNRVIVDVIDEGEEGHDW